jgi:hypothetical protein
MIVAVRAVLRWRSASHNPQVVKVRQMQTSTIASNRCLGVASVGELRGFLQPAVFPEIRRLKTSFCTLTLKLGELDPNGGPAGVSLPIVSAPLTRREQPCGKPFFTPICSALDTAAVLESLDYWDGISPYCTV